MLPLGLTQTVVCLPEGDQSSVIMMGSVVRGIIQVGPFYGIDSIRRTVAVFVEGTFSKGFGAEHLLTGQKEGDTLTEQRESRSEPASATDIFFRGSGKPQGEPVEEGVIVMTGDLVDALAGTAGPRRDTHET